MLFFYGSKHSERFEIRNYLEEHGIVFIIS